MSEFREEVLHSTSAPESKLLDKNESELTFDTPVANCQEMKRTKLVFIYSDEDEYSEVNNDNNHCEDVKIYAATVDVNNDAKLSESIKNCERNQQSKEEGELEKQSVNVHNKVKEVSIDCLLLNANLEDLQKDAKKISERANDINHNNNPACITPVGEETKLPFFEDVLSTEQNITDLALTTYDHMRVREVVAETLPFITRGARKNYENKSNEMYGNSSDDDDDVDKKNNYRTHCNKLRTHFTVDELDKTNISYKRFRDSEENSNNSINGDSQYIKNGDVNNESNESNTMISTTCAAVHPTDTDAKQEHVHVSCSNDAENEINNNDDDDDNDDDSDEEEEVQIHRIRPIVSEDGKVHVVESNGYCLTVNEEELLDLDGTSAFSNDVMCEESANSDEHANECNNMSIVQEHISEDIVTNDLLQCCHENNERVRIGKINENNNNNSNNNNSISLEEMQECQPEVKESNLEEEQEHEELLEEQEHYEEEEEEFNNNIAEYDNDESDEESDEELDQCLLVAITDRLVECCESPDLDSNLSVEAARFCAAAKPLLAQLQNNEITHETFEQRIHKELHRFMRIYKNVYKPRDDPIIIDGVKMDLE